MNPTEGKDEMEITTSVVTVTTRSHHGLITAAMIRKAFELPSDAKLTLWDEYSSDSYDVEEINARWEENERTKNDTKRSPP
jgi:hypothetical protein